MPSLYQEVLNHPSTSDELRRSTEAKLIRYKQKYFYALPTTSPEKALLGEELDELVNGVVIIGVPDELSWSIFLEGKDSDTIGACQSVTSKWSYSRYVVQMDMAWTTLDSI